MWIRWGFTEPETSIVNCDRTNVLVAAQVAGHCIDDAVSKTQRSTAIDAKSATTQNHPDDRSNNIADRYLNRCVLV